MGTLVLITLVLASAAYWIAQAVSAILVMTRVTRLAAVRPADPAKWPSLSVIIPACNEAKTLESAMRSKLAQDYPNLEFVLIDDRSTDATGAIVDRLAAVDSRVRAVHVSHLPAGWLGKLHALHRGLELAHSDFVLFSDADVHFAPETLQRAIAHCEASGLDFLAVFPELWPRGWVLDASLAAFGRVLFMAGRVWAASDPSSSAAIGVGAFNLVRRCALEQTGGFEWLKLEVADDVGLAQMLKRSGARCDVAIGRGLVGMHLYDTLKDAARAAEKGAAVIGFHLWRGLFASLTLIALETGVFLGIVLGWGTWVGALSAVATAIALATCIALSRFIGFRTSAAMAAPLGAVLMALWSIRASILASVRNGIAWRGTLYPASQLIAGRRLQFP